MNIITEMDGFLEVVSRNWIFPLIGGAMYILWKKLHILQPIIRDKSKQLSDIKLRLDNARVALMNAKKSGWLT